MARSSGRHLVALVLLLALHVGPGYARTVEHAQDAQLRRSLLGATQQISQCEWITGEGCALHPSYVTYALNRTLNDVVARYVSNSLACASVVEKGACEGVSYCVWDPAFANGQQGCFLAESAMLALQQQCIKPASRDSLAKLQSCMEARHSCQCTGGSTPSACQLRQQQLLAGFRSGSKVCQSLLGCWLSNLNGSTPDIMQLVEVQLGLVQPRMEALKPGSNSSNIALAAAGVNSTSSSKAAPAASSVSSSTKSSAAPATASGSGSTTTATGRRRALQQKLVLSNPVLDDASSTIGSDSTAAGTPDGFTFESGSYSTAHSTPAKPTSNSSTAPRVGMNGVILNDAAAAAPAPAGSPVEYGKNIPGPSSSSSGSSSSSMNPAYNLESGTATASDGSWQFEQAPVDPDKVFGNATSSTSSGSGSAGGSSSTQDVQMTGGNAPASFWKCAGAAAVKADATRKWADVDYNSKSLTLATWLKVIQPTSLIDWGVQVMECFKTEVAALSANSGGGTAKPNKESTEYAIVALIRTFSAEANTFRSYLQAGPDARATAGLSGLQVLSQQVFPDQMKSLMAKYNVSTAYNRDVMLQAAAVIADMEWFSADALALASGTGRNAQAQQQVFEAVVAYGEEMMRRCLYWLFHVQFEGTPAHLPGVPATTPASIALMDAFDGLAAAALPAPALAADAPAWQQLQGMLAVAAGWASNAAAQAQAGSKSSAQLTAAELLGNAMDGLARAHIADFWGTRVELARASAPDTSRQLALLDPSQQAARWQPLRDQQVQLLAALQQLQSASTTSSSSDAVLQQLWQRLQELVAASGTFLVSGSASSSATLQQQSQRLSDSLKYSSWLAFLVRQCYGSPAGLRPLGAAAAAAAGVPVSGAAACSLLVSETQRMTALAASGGDGIAGNLANSIGQHWACAARDPDTCNAAPGCQLALTGTVVPGSASGSSGPAAAASAELLLEGSAASDLQLSCQVADASLLLSSMNNSSKAGLAVSTACERFLQLPACELMQGAAACGSYSACRWELSSERNLVHTVSSSSASTSVTAASAAMPAAGAGVCSMDWVQVLSTGSGAAYSSLGSMISLCSSISDSAACTAQTMLITLDTSSASGGAGSIARIWVPALVVAAVLGLALFGGVMVWRRRSAVARRAAEQAQVAGSGGARGSSGSSKKGRDGKGGKASKAVMKKKVKRAEPGSYKPDLMRDSFTDYMRSAPQQFENGVAIAKAAMAAGSLDAAVAAGDVAGARPAGAMSVALTATAASGAGAAGFYYQQQQQCPQQPAGGAYGGGAVAAAGTGRPGRPSATQLPPLPPLGMHGLAGAAARGGFGGNGTAANNSSDLINLQMDVARGPAPLQQQATHQGPYGLNSMGYGGVGVGAVPVWGAAVGPSAATSLRISGGGLSAGLSGGLLSGGLSGEVDLIDTGASLALTSSLGLVSSLPQHTSLPLGVADAQQFVLQGLQQQQQQQQASSGGADDVVLGLPGPGSMATAAAAAAGRRSSGRGFSTASAGTTVEGANSGSLLLGGRGSGDIEDGASTPTSSCCHDSVCTFRHGPGSSLSSSLTRGAAAPPLSTSSSVSWRGGGGGTSRQPSGISGRAASTSGTAQGGGLGSALSGALSGALSRSSWSSALSTDMLMSSQHSAAIDP